MSIAFTAPYGTSTYTTRMLSKHPQLDRSIMAIKFGYLYGAGPNAIARILGLRRPCTRKAIPSRNKREGRFIGHAYGKAVRHKWYYREFHCVGSRDARWFS